MAGSLPDETLSICPRVRCQHVRKTRNWVDETPPIRPRVHCQQAAKKQPQRLSLKLLIILLSLLLTKKLNQTFSAK
jgi:hypothetical protein